MLPRKDVAIVAVLFLIAAVVALATYVLMDLFESDPQAMATPAPTQAPVATPTDAPTEPAAATPTDPPAPQPEATADPTPIPQFGSITFGTGINGDQVLNPGSTFPAGTKEVVAVWSYQNMVDGAPYHVSWVLDDSPWLHKSVTWDSGRYGAEGQSCVVHISEHDSDGLAPGNYRLEIGIGDRLSQLATFVVLGPTPTSPPPTLTPQPSVKTVGRAASRSLVELWVPVDNHEGYSQGSGSIVDGEQGLILTNWHVVAYYGSEDLYNKDGYVQVWLTLDPSWSPYRSQIVFTYNHNDDSDLYIMNADGSSWFQLTGGPADDVHPVWSPDNSRIAFVSNRDGDWEILVLHLGSGIEEQLTYNEYWDSFPAWSPDGTRLVFTSSRTGNYDLFLIDTGTGEETQLTTNPYSDAHPAWSPYGDEIVYTMVVAEGGNMLRELGVLNIWDPAHPRRLTESKPKDALHRYPDWSPDGKWIVFESQGDGTKDLFLMPVRGGIMTNLTRASSSIDTTPAWSR